MTVCYDGFLYADRLRLITGFWGKLYANYDFK